MVDVVEAKQLRVVITTEHRNLDKSHTWRDTLSNYLWNQVLVIPKCHEDEGDGVNELVRLPWGNVDVNVHSRSLTS
jgi:hypothetical protein